MKITIPASALVQTLKFIANESILPSLAWVQIEVTEDGITLAATDSYRLHEIKTKPLCWVFPSYAHFFLSEDTEKNKLSVSEFTNICKQAILVGDKKPKVRIGKEICIIASGEAYTVPSSYKCNHDDIVLDAKLFLEFLKSLPKHTISVEVQVKHPLSPFQITYSNENGKVTHIIMPLK